MKFLELSFDDPAANLACDEALLELAEADPSREACLRVWEGKKHFVVLGHSNQMRSDVNVAACVDNDIPITRRISGGGTVVQGPGCINYSLVLKSDTPHLKNIEHTFKYVLERHCSLVKHISAVEARLDGISDLTVDGRKFSGNAQYRKARCLLVHGTFLVNFDLALIEKILAMPAKQPAYRKGRSHLQFVANLNIAPAQLCHALRETWEAKTSLVDVPFARIDELVRTRYANDAWSKKF